MTSRNQHPLCILNMGYFKFIVGNPNFFLMFMNIIILGECQNTKPKSFYTYNFLYDEHYNLDSDDFWKTVIG